MIKTALSVLVASFIKSVTNKNTGSCCCMLVLACLISPVKTKAQLVSTGYVWSQSFQTYKAANSALPTPSDIMPTSWDDETYTGYTFPFNFTYNGTLYTAGVGTIGVDSDGWIAFSTGAIVMTGTTFGGSWVSASDHTGVYLNGTGNDKGFCGFNSDVEEQVFANFTGNTTNGSQTITAVSDFTNIRVGIRLSGTGITDGTVVNSFNAAAQTITMSGNATASGAAVAVTPRTSVYAFIRGIAPYRQWVIQWTRASRYSAVTGDDFSFQLVLNEGGGVATYQTLQAVYGSLTTSNPGSQNAQVGLRGNAATDFNARTTSSNWSATTVAGTNAATCNVTTAVFPTSGLTFTWSPPCSVVASNAGAITGTSPVCPGTSVDYSLPGVPGAIFYTWTYTGGGTTLSGTTTLPLNTLNFGPAATSGTLTVTPGNICGNGASSSYPITVASVTSATITYPLAIYCQSTAGTISPTLTGPGGGTYTSSPSGLIMTSAGVITPSTSTAGTYTITYTYTSGSCTVTTTTTVQISPNPIVSVTATPSLVCSGGSSQLSVSADAGGNYSVASIAYSSLAPAAATTTIWSTTYADENVSAAIPIPFAFNYYGQNITQLYAYVNGYITLQNTYASALTPQAVPNPATPNNVIALAWDDLEVDTSINPTAYVRYFVNGTAPNRIMVIDYNQLDFFFWGGVVTGQIRLYESDNHIEVAVTTVDDDLLLDPKTLGIENALGTVGITPAGRNNAVWNVSNEAWSFTPKPVSYLWTPATFLSSTVISNPVANAVTSTTAYNVKVTDVATGCFANGTVTLTLGAPLSGVYTVGAGGNFTTLTAAVNAYNSLCLGGPVTFSLIDNNYPSETYPISINNNIYASSTNTLTIKPAAGKTPLFTGSSASTLIQLNGCDYVTIDGSNTLAGTSRDLSFTNTAATSNAVVWITSSSASDGATNNSINNCNIYGASGSGTIAAILTGSYITAGADAEFPNNNNTIQNNLLYRAQNGIYQRGKAASLDLNWLITKNNVGSSVAADKMGFRGIAILNAQNFTVSNNKIAGVNDAGTTTSNMSGLFIGLNINTGNVYQNTISDVKHTSVYGSNGIYLGAATTASALNVYNNFIFDIASSGFNARTVSDNGYGIAINAGGGYNVYYNTVHLGTNQTTGTNFPSAILITSGVTTANSIRLKNNIFQNTQTVAGQRYAIQSTATSAVFDSINYNGYFTTGVNPGYLSGNLATLAAIQGAYGKNTNSFVPATAAVFRSATDMHIDTTNASNIANWKNKGGAIPGYTDDYDVTTRNGYTPDVGGDEWVEGKYGSWVGKTSIDWLVPSNWEANVVPDRGTDVFITGGYAFMPTIVTTQPVRGLTLAAPVPANTPILTINAGTLQVYGTIVRTGGSIDGTNGTLEMDSTIVSQPIPASLFVNNALKDLLINNSNNPGVTIMGPLDIYRSVTYGSSGASLITNSNLTFKSTATETAWLGNTTGKILTGTVTIERYIPTGINHAKTWQLLAAPIKSAVSLKVSWMENNVSLGDIKHGYGTTISSEVINAVSRGYDFYTPISGSTGGPSLKTYVPATNTWAGFDDGATATGSKALTPQKKGYFLFVRGDRSVQTAGGGAVPTVLRITGTPYYGTGATAPPTTTVLANSFETIGNPYPSAIDFTLVTKAAGVDNVFYLWDPRLPGTNSLGGYQTISGVTGWLPTPGSTNYPAATPVKIIQSGQAFFVHGTAGGLVSFTEATKVSGSSLVVRQQSPHNLHLLRLDLYKISSSYLGPVDGNVVVLDKDYSNAFDNKDALKISNSTENIGIASNDKILAVEARKPFVKNDTLFYNMGNLRADAYQFRFGPENIQADNLSAFLVDRYLNTMTPVSLTDSTFIDFTIINEEGSYAADRFYLIFQKRQHVIPPVAARSSAIHNSEILPADASITVHPNPLVNKVLTISFTNQPAGAYQLELSNKLGQVIFSRAIKINDPDFTESIQLGKEIATGNYQLSIIGENGKKVVQQVVVN